MNKDDVHLIYDSMNEYYGKFVKVQIKPDPKTYREIWSTFCPNSRRKETYIQDNLCGFFYVKRRKAKDWFGIDPFLK